jgi:phosphoribosylformylglycinamidine synthase
MPTQFRVGIIRFPGTNCDLDTWESVALVPGLNPVWVSHRERTDPGLSALILPGGFSYGDYLRTGSIAAQAPVMNLVIDYANQGLPVLGICNGFQILAETGLLPGVLLTNRNRTFICQEENLVIDRVDTPFTALFSPGSRIVLPIAHQEGRFFLDPDQLQEIERNGQILLRYSTNPNGSSHSIAGVTSPSGNVAGLMPHPERRARWSAFSSTDGFPFFQSLFLWLSKHAMPQEVPTP